MISGELEITLLILALYGSTCVVFAYANEGVLQRGLHGLYLRLADDRLRIAGRSLVWLNPLLPMRPAFRGPWGDAEAMVTAPDRSAHLIAALNASATLAPYILAVFLCAIVGIPASLLLVGAERALPIVGLAYAAAIVLMARLWFLRESFSLDGWKFALLAFESIACLPFAAGLVRRLSLTVPVPADLASFLVQMPTAPRQQALAALLERSEEIAGFLPTDSAAFARLDRYRTHLATLASSDTDVSAPVVPAEEP